MSLSSLSKKSLVIVFAYAPAGLGHLRVTDALYHGLPKDVTPVLLGTHDKSISWQHRFISIHPITRAIFEAFQNGFLGNIPTVLYRHYLQSHTTMLYQQMATVLDERIDLPQTVLIIATHYGLAHQLAALKDQIVKDRMVKVFLVVQVTDDSPQPIWYVPGADLTFAPSLYTKDKLLEYGKKTNLPKVSVQVSSYPITPYLSEHLKSHLFEERIQQSELLSHSQIHVSIPVSGAAVGTDVITNLIDLLHEKSERFLFHVTVKQALYTRDFLTEMLKRPYVHLGVSTHDRGTVNNYEALFKRRIIGFEITKPSEQAFKALLNPTQRGGAVLLFTNPIGKQEHDNLQFLHRHHLIPSRPQQAYLWKKSQLGEMVDKKIQKDLLLLATNWRGILLPQNPFFARQLIWWCLQEDIFKAMMRCDIQEKNHHPNPEELSPSGVQDFWNKVSDLIKQ